MSNINNNNNNNSNNNLAGLNFFNPSRCMTPRSPFREVLLASNTGSAGPFPIITTFLSDPVNVVSTCINTTGLNRSTNLLIFTCQINLPLGISVNLNFEIIRMINGRNPAKIGPTFTFSTLAVALESEAFAFQFADFNAEEGNYTYTIQISTNSILDITPGLTVNNGTLSIIAVRN